MLTLSAQEALRFGVADKILETSDEVIEAFGLSEAELVAHQESAAERVLRFLGSPVVQSILMLMMLGGLYFELQTPGVGFAGSVALIGAAMFFAPHYLLGLVEVWEILLFGIGVMLILAEIFVIPGFGIAGVSGILLVLVSLVVSLVGNVGFSFPPLPALTPAVATVATTMVLLVLTTFALGRYLPKTAMTNISAMFFAPHYLLGLVEVWEILLFGIGVMLILAEIFVIPGFGIAGVSGILLVLVSLVVSLVGNVGFSFPPLPALTPAVATVATTMVLLVLTTFALGRYLPKTERFNRLVLVPELSSATGYTAAASHTEYIGQTGRTLTPLRPSGAVEIDGTRVDVVTSGEFISHGEQVKVVSVRGSRVEVRLVKVLPPTGETSPA